MNLTFTAAFISSKSLVSFFPLKVLL